MSISNSSWPSFNARNFSKFQPDSVDKRTTKKLSLYVSTADNTPQQVIKKDRSNILLRYLHQQRGKKNKNDDVAKRKVSSGTAAENVASSSIQDEPRKKIQRVIDAPSGSRNPRNTLDDDN